MIKKIRFNTISLGSEPDQPDIPSLIQFIRSYRGEQADLITFNLIHSLSIQIGVGISSPGAGGFFCLPRIEAAISCSSDECFHDSSDIIADTLLMIHVAGPVRSVFPAPHLSHGSPNIRDEERYADYCDEFAGVLRDMRDKGIISHCLHAKEVNPIEIERIVSSKNQIIIPGGDEGVQGALLEHQPRITLHNSRIAMLGNLIDHYDIRHLIIIDPDKEGFRVALEHLDPDQISAGGYGIHQEESYWKEIVEKASTPLHSEY
ncbi:MAG: hypothetical protein CVV33_06310 [Methanomicrobiales archaeon HGW-Methanomicrobiales-4]|nr:MAG: hypothetical protein CVV33_06310 [Methanomicrobiales archaeon HGW-Methanomicrobiales-4]